MIPLKILKLASSSKEKCVLWCLIFVSLPFYFSAFIDKVKKKKSIKWGGGGGGGCIIPLLAKKILEIYHEQILESLNTIKFKYKRRKDKYLRLSSVFVFSQVYSGNRAKWPEEFLQVRLSSIF